MADTLLTQPPPASGMAPGDAPGDPLAGVPLPVLPPGVPQPMSFADIMAGMQGRIAELPRPSEAMAAEQTARAVRERQGAGLEAAAAEQEPRLRALEGAYADTGSSIGATPVPQAPILPQPPSRGLRAFLATSPDEAPEATLQKVMAGVMTLATSMGGLVRGDGRAALAALSGAMQGWHEGDKERADRAFADWKARSDQMLQNYNLERTSYEDALKAKTLPLEMQKAALMIAGQRWDNAKAIAAFNSGSADQWAQFVGGMSKEGNKLSEDVGKLAIMKGEKDKALDLQERTLAETIRNHIAETARKDKDKTAEDLKLLKDDVRTRLAADPEARRYIDAGMIPPDPLVRAAVIESDKVLENRAASVQLYAAGLPQRTPETEMKRLQDISVGRSQLDEMGRLAPEIRLEHVMGGLRPWFNKIIETERVGPFPVKLTATLTDPEMRFLAVARRYAEGVLRQLSGAAINETEFPRMLSFLPNETATPQAFLVRLKTEDDLSRVREQAIRGSLIGGGFRADEFARPSMAPQESPTPQGAGPGRSKALPGETIVQVRRRSDKKLGELIFGKGVPVEIPAGYEVVR